MLQPPRPRLTVDEFYAWIAGQQRRHELVDGEPVMMAGANRRHDRIASNLLRLLGNHLQGHRCQPFTSDTYIRIPAGNARQPDVGIDCGPFRDDSLEAAEPALVVEILSPTTRTFDRNDKLEEYKTVASLDYILIVDPDWPQLRLYRRDAGRAWISDRRSGLEGAVEMTLFGLVLTLADIYAGLEFRPRPTLVDPLDPASRFAL